jgi:hypothetical protein
VEHERSRRHRTAFAARAVTHSPFDAPWQGRETIVGKWLARRDAPGAASFRYEVLATTADGGIVRGWTLYRRPRREFSNVWLVRLDSRGRCREFIEWWMQRR